MLNERVILTSSSLTVGELCEFMDRVSEVPPETMILVGYSPEQGQREPASLTLSVSLTNLRRSHP
jgi:hypothetical protein